MLPKQKGMARDQHGRHMQRIDALGGAAFEPRYDGMTRVRLEGILDFGWVQMLRLRDRA